MFSDDVMLDDVILSDVLSVECWVDVNVCEMVMCDDVMLWDDDVVRCGMCDVWGWWGCVGWMREEVSDDDDVNDGVLYWVNVWIVVMEYVREDVIEIVWELCALGATATERYDEVCMYVVMLF